MSWQSGLFSFTPRSLFTLLFWAHASEDRLPGEKALNSLDQLSTLLWAWYPSGGGRFLLQVAH